MGYIKIVKDNWHTDLYLSVECPHCKVENHIGDDKFEQFGIIEGEDVNHLIECIWCNEVFRLKADKCGDLFL